MEVIDRIRKARICMLSEYPFFGVLALNLKPVESPELPTVAGTDGYNLYYNPTLIGTMTDDQIRGVIAHEVWHPALGHLTRRGPREAVRWNIAADMAVNERLKKDGFQLLLGVPLNESFFGMSTEHMYSLLPSFKEEVGNKGIQKYIRSGNGNKNENSSPLRSEYSKYDQHIQQASNSDAARKLDEEWTQRITRAATIAKNRGNLPASAQELLDEIFSPKLAWTDWLRKFIVQQLQNDYSFIPPNKKYIETGFVFPSLYSEGLNTIVIGVDTSGSIDLNDDLKQFYGEIQNILDSFDVDLHVIQCDAEVKENYVKVYRKGDRVVGAEIHGRGGTDFRPVFEYVKEHQLDPQCLVFFTDLIGSFPKRVPEYPVLWVASTDGKVPFGEVLRLKDPRRRSKDE